MMCGIALAQTTVTAPRKLPEFEVATIKPSKGGMAGLYTYPGGRIFCGLCSLRLMIVYAFNVREFQVTGGPRWIDTDRYDIAAIPPEGSPARKLQPSWISAPPSRDQREMLQSLLTNRFHLQFHRMTRAGNVLWLVRTKKKFGGSPSRDASTVPFMTVAVRPNGAGNGEVIGENTSMAYMAQRLSDILGLSVINKTGLEGSFDFDLPAPEQANADRTNATLEGLNRLGLKLVREKGQVEFIVVDNATPPSAN